MCLGFFTVNLLVCLTKNCVTLPAVNYYHKALHLGCCSSPRSASAFLVKAKFLFLRDASEYLQVMTWSSKIFAVSAK